MEAPITVAGLTALSVETSTNVSTAELARDPRDQPRRERVVADRLDGVELHHPDVLVGGGVEDDRGPVLGEHLAHPLLLAAVGEHGHGERDVALLLELARDLEQVVLGVVDEHELLRADARDLAAELRADRSAGAGHEHDLAGEVGADALEIHPHRLAAEHVLDADLAQLAGDAQLRRRRPAAARTRSASSAPGFRAAGRRSTTRARTVPGRRRDRDHDLVGLDLVEHPREVGVLGRAEHPQPVLVLEPALARIVVDEADRPQPQLRVADELAHDEAAAVAAADDQHVAGALGHAETGGSGPR